jgi:hypothetical protein
MLGDPPRRKRSTTIMRPPQHGQAGAVSLSVPAGSESAWRRSAGAASRVDPGDVGGPRPAGEEAVVADTMEAVCPRAKEWPAP